MRLKIALCDDNARALPVIAGAVESAFSAHSIQTEIRCFTSGEALLSAMDETRFHLLLLDIEMPGMDGIEIGKRLWELGDNARIVYVSEAEARVFEAFSVQPLGFVRKSNFLNDIASVVELYLKTVEREEKDDYLEFKGRSGILAFRIKQIRYMEGNGNYQFLYLEGKNEPAELKMTMGKLETLTEPFGFIRVHKGFLVNYLWIQRISPTAITLSDGTVIPIGRGKGQEVKDKYLSLIER